MITGIGQYGAAAYSSIMRTQPAGSLPNSARQTFSVKDSGIASTAVTISQQALNAFNSDNGSSIANRDEEAKKGCQFLTGKAINDPEAAESMAHQLANSRDGELMSLSDVPINGPTARFASMSEYNQHVAAFDAIANNAQLQRQKIYDQMKANGSSGLEIYESLMKFNTTLPADYQKATGIGMVAETFFNYSK